MSKDISKTPLISKSIAGPDRFLYINDLKNSWYLEYPAYVEVFWEAEVQPYLVYIEVEPFFRSAEHTSHISAHGNFHIFKTSGTPNCTM